MNRIKNHAIVVVNLPEKDPFKIHNKEGVVIDRDLASDKCILNVEGEEYWVDEKDLIDTGKIKDLPKPQFNFYEVVKVETEEVEYAEINGCEGIIGAMGQNIDGSWGYGVDFNDEGWDVPEYALKKTGKFVSRDKLYDGSYLKVSIKGELKGGHLVGYDDEEDNKE